MLNPTFAQTVGWPADDSLRHASLSLVCFSSSSPIQSRLSPFSPSGLTLIQLADLCRIKVLWLKIQRNVMTLDTFQAQIQTPPTISRSICRLFCKAGLCKLVILFGITHKFC
jgi:hypothetical protein